MAIQNPSGDQGSITSAEDALKRQRLDEEFPLGIAPYTRGNLLAFGFWGGIVGAGIAGAVNYRRAKQGQLAFRILILMVVLVAAYEVVWNVVLVKLFLSGNSADSTTLETVGSAAYVVVGMIFAAWIAGRQQSFLQRWLELAGAPRWKEQGGCLRAIGWVILGGIVAVILALAVQPVIERAAVQVMYPAQTFTVQGVTVGFPNGWEQASPDLFSVKCDGSEGVCIALGKDNWSGSTALVRTYAAQGATTQQFANGVVASLQQQKITLAHTSPQLYTSAALNGHDAYSIDGSTNGVQFIFTVIGNGSNVLDFVLNCTDELDIQCSSLRDQIASTFVFAPGSGTAVTPAATPAAVSSRQ